MKKILRILFSGFIILATCQLTSCGGGKDNTPVDQIVEVLDKTARQAEELTGDSDLSTIQNVIYPEEAVEIIRNNYDYVLSDNDKKKLKKSFDNLLKVAYEKTAEVANFPDEMKKSTMSQLKLVTDGVNSMIENANTLGELSQFR